MRTFPRVLVLGILAATLTPGAVHAAMVQLKVTVENLAPQNSIAFAPLRMGFHSGSFDVFNNGEEASAAIISIAEGGSGSDWFPALAAADPTSMPGSVVPDPAGPLLPGAMAYTMLTVDTSINPYFTFASMVVPSNDYFIGNDSPMQYMLFDDMGNLNLTEIVQQGSDIWDAGSEATDPANAAFLEGGTNSLRTPQGGVVNFDFADLATFDGLTTGAGYMFDSQLAADTNVYRISFEVVPEPNTMALVGVGALGAMAMAIRRRGFRK